MRRRASGSGGAAARRARIAGALLVALLASACGVAPMPDAITATPAPAPAHVLLELVQLRGDVAGGFVELRVTNMGADELVIERATYESSAWSAPMERVDDARIPPGSRRNLRLQLPEPTCAAGAVEHRATLDLADGTVVEGVPEDPFSQLERLDDPVCDLRAFAEDVAGLAWLEADIPADGSGLAVLRLQVSPVAGAGARLGSVDAVAATVLLNPADASGGRLEELPVALDVIAGAAPSVVEVPLVPGRCDLHAVAEDKQGTIFLIRATAGEEAVDLRMAVPDAQRGALLGWVVARCGS